MLLFPETCFLPTAVAPLLTSWFYQSLPFFSLVFHSFVKYCIGDSLLWMHYGFSERLERVSAVLPFTLPYLKVFEVAAWKQGVVIHHDQVTPTFWLLTRVHTLTIKHSVHSIMAERCFLCCSPFITPCNGLNMSECKDY